jgi:hypothetical protein
MWKYVLNLFLIMIYGLVAYFSIPRIKIKEYDIMIIPGIIIGILILNMMTSIILTLNKNSNGETMISISNSILIFVAIIYILIKILPYIIAMKLLEFLKYFKF